MGKVRGKVAYGASQIMYPDNERGEVKAADKAVNGHHRDQSMKEVAEVIMYNQQIGDLRFVPKDNGTVELRYKKDRAKTGDEGEEYAGWQREFSSHSADVPAGAYGVGMGDMEQKPYDKMRATYEQHMADLAAREQLDVHDDYEDDDDYDFDE